MIAKTKKFVRIRIDEWEKLRRNPLFAELVELLEDSKDLIRAKKIRGKDIRLEYYLQKRGIQHNS